MAVFHLLGIPLLDGNHYICSCRLGGQTYQRKCFRVVLSEIWEILRERQRQNAPLDLGIDYRSSVEYRSCPFSQVSQNRTRVAAKRLHTFV